jgi:hypothetical protein
LDHGIHTYRSGRNDVGHHHWWSTWLVEGYQMVTETEELNKIEEKIADRLTQMIVNDPEIVQYAMEKIKSFNLDFDPEGPLTDTQENLVCTYQGQIYSHLLALVIRYL